MKKKNVDLKSKILLNKFLNKTFFFFQCESNFPRLLKYDLVIIYCPHTRLHVIPWELST